MEKPARDRENLKIHSWKKSATSLQSPSSNTHERARDKFVYRWKADRQVGHPVILGGPAKMIGRAFYSITASTDDIFLWIFCQST